MPSKKPVQKAAGNRQAAYTSRNRAALIKSGQEVLADIGPGATIEDLANHAQVSPTTIYKYFESKEVLFSEARTNLADSRVFEKTTITARGLFRLDAAVCVFRSGLCQPRDRKFSISLQKRNRLPQKMQ